MSARINRREVREAEGEADDQQGRVIFHDLACSEELGGQSIFEQEFGIPVDVKRASAIMKRCHR